MFEFEAPPDFLKDHKILITGASDGIGKTCAQTFAKYGADLFLLGRSQEKLEALYDELEELAPGRVTIQPMDFALAKSDDYKALAEHYSELHQSLDVMLHNAALLGARSPIEFYPDSDWDSLMTVNVNAAFCLTKAFLPLLMASPDGRLLFTSSSVGRTGRAYWGAYAVSKFANEGLMQTLADELGKTSSVKVNSINPGGTRTAMRQAAYPAEKPDTQPSPADLMPVYLYLLSDAAKNIHGKAIDVRGFDPASYE